MWVNGRERAAVTAVVVSFHARLNPIMVYRYGNPFLSQLSNALSVSMLCWGFKALPGIKRTAISELLENAKDLFRQPNTSTHSIGVTYYQC